MAAEYQDTDWRIADYQTFCLDPSILDAGSGKPLYLRGPRPSSLMPGTYFACIGAAQTFGRFCPKPYPTLLQERLGLPVALGCQGFANEVLQVAAQALKEARTMRHFDTLANALFYSEVASR